MPDSFNTETLLVQLEVLVERLASKRGPRHVDYISKEDAAKVLAMLVLAARTGKNV